MDRPETWSYHFLTRRRLIGVAGAAGVVIASSAAGARAVAQIGTPVPPAQLAEAPILAAQVQAGTLPAVTERLPANPMVVQPNEQVGQYGGVWRTALVGGSDTAWLTRTIAYENLVQWDPEWKEVVPNVAMSWEASADAREFTFKLREGMKWSDGAPFTADDILFYAEDVYRNEELTSGLGRNPFTAEKLDEVTVKIAFERSNGLFIQNLATPLDDGWARYPKHYLQQFHPKYNTTTLDSLIAENGVADWVELFRLKGAAIPGTPYDARWSNLELPTLIAWKIVEPYGEGQRVVASRNPYYWKVDPDGNQLPYLDEVNYGIVQNNEVLLLQAANGEIDMHVRHINIDANKSVLADAQEAGQFHFFDTVPAIMNTAVISLNLTHKIPVMREIFQNKDFRIGLSHAINRQEIIDTVYVSQGEPWQAAPRRETAFYNERLAKQYTEYDIELANQHLDAVVPEKDGDGFRLRPDGERLTILVEVDTTYDAAMVDAMNLVVGYWQQIGVDARLTPEDRSLLFTRILANEHDCAPWPGAGGLDVILNAAYYLPFRDGAKYAIAWATWYEQPANPQAEPEEPPEEVKRQFELYERIEATSDDREQTDLMRQILEIAAEQFYSIGISLPGNGYGIVKNTFRNVPAEMPDAWLYPTPAPTNPEQYYVEQ